MLSCKPCRFVLLFLIASLPTRAADQEITGVQPAALDQPRIYMLLRRTPAGPPLAAKGDKGLAGLLGLGKDDKDAATFTIEAFLDTGASGIMLSSDTASALGIQPAQLNNQPVIFEDVGVAGSERFGVSESLVASFAAYSSTTAGDDPASYSKPSAPLRLQLRPAGGILDMLTGGLDVAGMPAMANRVVVMDPKPVNTFADKIRTSILQPTDATIPKTACHIPLTYVSFQRFTRTTPPGAPPPALLPNPMIGPDPLKAAAASAPTTAPTSRVSQGWRAGSNGKRVLTLGGSAPANPTIPMVAYNGRSASITFLLDTGSAASLISRRTADQLGIHYTPDGSKLEGIPENQQFSLTIGGIGGNKTAAGFYLDSLSLPTRERQPIVFKRAPVLVHDISVQDPTTRQTFTLDGVLGMNYLVASANVTGGLLPDIKDLTQGPFSMIVIDHPHATLGVTIAGN